jgi:myo-inositol-1(or 4)-monophosphatase
VGGDPPARLRVSPRETARTRPEPAELCALAVEAASAGADLLAERFARGEREGVRTKSTPTDLVSDADLASQSAIRELLERRRPEDGFLGEEEGADERESGGGLRWIVDPLDGTVNFLFGIPQWCVSVAVQDAGGLTLAGAIVDPGRGETWSATAGGEATLNGRRISGSDRVELASAMVATGLYYDAAVRAEQGPVLARLASRVRDIRRFGSAALDLAWTAAGRYDAYFERGVKLWDVAAGELICERAGLEIVSLDGRGVLPPGVLVAPAALVEPLAAIVA